MLGCQHIAAAVCFAVLGIVAVLPAQSHAADFYAGKTLERIVGGAPGGDKDEVCTRAGLAKIQDRVK